MNSFPSQLHLSPSTSLLHVSHHRCLHVLCIGHSDALTNTMAASSSSSSSFWHPSIIFPISILLRIGLLLYGRWQDANSPLKYTDIDYYVFTDAAKFANPYDRATYRYTPLLAWLLLPTTWGGWWFEFGKVLFAASDVVTGWIVMRILCSRGMSVPRALKFAGIWLLNPMVAQISTRGSSEGLMAVLVVALLWTTLNKRIVLAGCLLGFAVHFKIYPFIYAASIFWWLGREPQQESMAVRELSISERVAAIFTRERIVLAVASFATVMLFNVAMYSRCVWHNVRVSTLVLIFVDMGCRSLSIAMLTTSFGSTTDTTSLSIIRFCTSAHCRVKAASRAFTSSRLPSYLSCSCQWLPSHCRWRRRIWLAQCLLKRTLSSHSTKSAQVRSGLMSFVINLYLLIM